MCSSGGESGPTQIFGQILFHLQRRIKRHGVQVGEKVREQTNIPGEWLM